MRCSCKPGSEHAPSCMIGQAEWASKGGRSWDGIPADQAAERATCLERNRIVEIIERRASEIRKDIADLQEEGKRLTDALAKNGEQYRQKCGRLTDLTHLISELS